MGDAPASVSNLSAEGWRRGETGITMPGVGGWGENRLRELHEFARQDTYNRPSRAGESTRSTALRRHMMWRMEKSLGDLPKQRYIYHGCSYLQWSSITRYFDLAQINSHYYSNHVYLFQRHEEIQDVSKTASAHVNKTSHKGRMFNKTQIRVPQPGTFPRCLWLSICRWPLPSMPATSGLRSQYGDLFFLSFFLSVSFLPAKGCRSLTNCRSRPSRWNVEGRGINSSLFQGTLWQIALHPIN